MIHRLRAVRVWTCSVVLSTVPATRAADVPAPPRFGGGVEVIRVSVSVTDEKDRYVGGLPEDAFAVFEDGVRQDLSFFARDALPLSVALLVDCSASMEQKIQVAQEAGARFLRALRPGDLAEVVQFNDRVRVLHDWSGDSGALEEALRTTRPSGATVLYNALYVTLKELRTQGTPDVPRRRAVVLLSDGEDTASLATEEQVLELAREAEIAIYAIRLRSDPPMAREREGQGRAKYFLTALARDTGGQVFFPDRLGDLQSVYARIADDLRSQYTLGYVSSNAARDGRWRRILVRTPQNGALRSRHKLGYYGAR
ncbi:MAG TPA: VWA domain-containing protein [Vicinamibacteria bacterium]|nr:VWA domain-containing protein [Vicinamibacteria bacterium]